MAKRLGQAALAVLIGFGVVTGGGARGQTAPPEAFYAPPSPLPAGAPGSVIRSMPLTSSAALPSAGRNLVVLYRSMDAQGREVAVSGTVAIPKGEPPAGGWPVISWFHGTTGFGPACAPSRDTPEGPEHAFLGPKQALKDDYVRRGYAVVATDYAGLGGPFLQGVPEGRSGLDMLRAAREVEPRIGTDYVAWGHSQGGQAALFAGALAPDYAPEFGLLGVVALAPASHIGETLRAMATAEQPSYALGYAMYVLQSFASDHAGIDLGAILAPEALAHLPQTRVDCITRTTTDGYWATAIPKDQFLPGADLRAVLEIAAANEPGALAVPAPVLIAQGGADETVMPAWTDAVAGQMCGLGDGMLYSVYPEATHETIPAAAAVEVADWIDARFAEAAAGRNCDALPKAAGPAG